MKKSLALLAILISQVAFAIPTEYSFKINKKLKSLQLFKASIVPSKVTEKMVSVKNMHGKTITRKVEVPPMDTSDKYKSSHVRP